jgi:hypothetical protein
MKAEYPSVHAQDPSVRLNSWESRGRGHIRPEILDKPEPQASRGVVGSILSYIDVDETYRRDIKGIRNLQEGRHDLARKICHGRLRFL